MGTFTWPMEIISPDGLSVATVDALVDTGSSYTVLPGSFLRSLSIQPTEIREFELGDGRVISLQIGEARLRVEGREFTRIVVFGDDESPALLGADTLQGASLAVDSVGHRLVPTRGLIVPVTSRVDTTRRGDKIGAIPLGI